MACILLVLWLLRESMSQSDSFLVMQQHAKAQRTLRAYGSLQIWSGNSVDLCQVVEYFMSKLVSIQHSSVYSGIKRLCILQFIFGKQYSINMNVTGRIWEVIEPQNPGTGVLTLNPSAKDNCHCPRALVGEQALMLLSRQSAWDCMLCYRLVVGCNTWINILHNIFMLLSL